MDIRDHYSIEYQVNTSTMYPAMLAMLRDISEGKATDDFHLLAGVPSDNPIHTQYLPIVMQTTPDVWDLALNPTMDANGHLSLDAPSRKSRAMALELARLIFTELLHIGHGNGTMRLRLSRDDTYRIAE